MRLYNVEFKARCDDLDAARAILKQHGAEGPTVDIQVDIYYRVPRGRLKLRDGAVERALIYYDRPNAAEVKPSRVELWPLDADAKPLAALLSSALGVLAVVSKRREIWWLDGVKVHLDEVHGLGSFVEAEAIGSNGTSHSGLTKACERVRIALGVDPGSFVGGSYSDLLLAQAHST